MATKVADPCVKLLYEDATGVKAADPTLLKNWRPIELQDKLWKFKPGHYKAGAGIPKHVEREWQMTPNKKAL